jgi:hypothetical protein
MPLERTVDIIGTSMQDSEELGEQWLGCSR